MNKTSKNQTVGSEFGEISERKRAFAFHRSLASHRFLVFRKFVKFSRKSQITLIIAIAIFIVIIAAFIFYAAYYFKNKNPIEPLAFERLSIENYINGCVKKTAEEGLNLFGKKGFVVDNDFKIPDIEQIRNELSLYINNNLNICLKDFKDFKKQGWDVEKGNINAKTQINQEDVAFDVDFPLKITYKGNTINFERFVTKINVRLKNIYDLINKIVEFDSKYKRHVDLSTLNEYNVNISISDFGDSLVYVIDDPKSLIMNEPYRFVLALKSE